MIALDDTTFHLCLCQALSTDPFFLPGLNQPFVLTMVIDYGVENNYKNEKEGLICKKPYQFQNLRPPVCTC
jgi:hypothetical protein